MERRKVCAEVRVFYFDPLICSFSLNTFLVPHWPRGTLVLLVHQNLVDPQVFLPSHFFMPTFLGLWNLSDPLALPLLLLLQQGPWGWSFVKAQQLLKSSSCCCWDLSSVVRHDLIQPYLLLLFLIAAQYTSHQFLAWSELSPHPSLPICFLHGEKGEGTCLTSHSGRVTVTWHLVQQPLQAFTMLLASGHQVAAFTFVNSSLS